MVSMPRWFILQEKIDYYLWELGCMLQTEQRLSAIE